MSLMHAPVADEVVTIAEDVFTAMVDGEPGTVTLWSGDEAPAADTHAWVDVVGPFHARALISMTATTADELARALLAMAPDEAVSDADLVDAVGEIANVVGGNVKALLPDGGALTLPRVSHVRPDADGALAHEVTLSWRGAAVVISLWHLDG